MHKPSALPPKSSQVATLRMRFERPSETPASVPSRTASLRPAHRDPVVLGLGEEQARRAHQELEARSDARPVQDPSAGGTRLGSGSPPLLGHLDRSQVPSRGKGSATADAKPAETPAKAVPSTPTAEPSADRASGPVVRFTEGDFLYGPDTGIQKPRTLLRKFVQSKTEQGGQRVWGGHADDTLKIDSLTSGMGPKPPVPTRHQLAGKPLPSPGTASTTGALPADWETNTGTRFPVRAEDKREFVEWIAKHPRFSPALSPEHTDWNRRFKRTSKAGLQFALQEKGYHVHFVLPKGTDFQQIVREAGSHP